MTCYIKKSLFSLDNRPIALHGAYQQRKFSTLDYRMPQKRLSTAGCWPLFVGKSSAHREGDQLSGILLIYIPVHPRGPELTWWFFRSCQVGQFSSQTVVFQWLFFPRIVQFNQPTSPTPILMWGSSSITNLPTTHTGEKSALMLALWYMYVKLCVRRMLHPRPHP